MTRLRKLLVPGFLGLLVSAWQPSLSDADDLSATVSLTTDYLWRGYSKSNQAQSLQANIDYSALANGSGHFAGAWVASVDFGDAYSDSTTDLETVIYAGWSQLLTPDQRLDVQVSVYLYDGRVFDADADYLEYAAFWRYRDLLSVELSYAPEAYGIGPSSWNLQFTGVYPLAEAVDMSAGVGYFKADEVFAYDVAYWNLGATWRRNHLALDLRYMGATRSGHSVDYWPVRIPFHRDRVVLTLSLGF